MKQVETQLPSAPDKVSVCALSLMLPCPPTQPSRCPHGAHLPSVVFPTYGPIMATQTPEVLRPPHQSPAHGHIPSQVATGASCPSVSPKTSGCPCLLTGSHGLRPVSLWLGPILRRPVDLVLRGLMLNSRVEGWERQTVAAQDTWIPVLQAG